MILHYYNKSETNKNKNNNKYYGTENDQLLDIAIKKDKVQQKLEELNCNKSQGPSGGSPIRHTRHVPRDPEPPEERRGPEQSKGELVSWYI